MSAWASAGAVPALAALFGSDAAAAAEGLCLAHGAAVSRRGARGRVRTRPRSRPDAGADPAPAGASFTCEQCGAVLTYAPGTSELTCPYCGHSNPIVDQPIEIVEHDLTTRCSAASTRRRPRRRRSSSAELRRRVHASSAPSTPAAARSAASRSSPTPAASARSSRRRCCRSRSTRAQRASGSRAGSRASGSRPPSSSASGAPKAGWPACTCRTGPTTARPRPTIAASAAPSTSSRCSVMRVVNGRRVAQTEMVQKVRWPPASGRVQRHFDDVAGARQPLAAGLDHRSPRAVGPARSAPLRAGLSDRLSERGLSGGARRGLRGRQGDDARGAAGGRRRRHRRRPAAHRAMEIRHARRRPSSTCCCRSGSARYATAARRYRLCVNGRTGQVQGERPYSVWKILAAVVVALVVAGAIAYMMAGAGYTPSY